MLFQHIPKLTAILRSGGSSHAFLANLPLKVVWQAQSLGLQEYDPNTQKETLIMKMRTFLIALKLRHKSSTRMPSIPGALLRFLPSKMERKVPRLRSGKHAEKRTLKSCSKLDDVASRSLAIPDVEVNILLKLWTVEFRSAPKWISRKILIGCPGARSLNVFISSHASWGFLLVSNNFLWMYSPFTYLIFAFTRFHSHLKSALNSKL